MFRRQTDDPPVLKLGAADAREAGEHEALERLHEARRAYTRAVELKRKIEQTVIDTKRELDAAKRDVRKAAER